MLYQWRVVHYGRQARRVFASTILILAAACGSGSSNTDNAVESQGGAGAPAQLLEGLSAPSNLTVSLAGSDSAAIVVNGGVSGEGGPEARLYGVADGVDTLIDLPLPVDEPLYNISSWSTGAEVVIVGLMCPRWVDSANPPTPDYDSVTGFSDICGSDAYAMFVWSPATKKWRDGGREFFRTGAGLFLRAHAGEIAVFAPIADVKGAFYKLDTATGTVTPVPDIPVGGVSQVCVAEDGRLQGIGMWSDDMVSADRSRQPPSDWPDERIVDTGSGQHLVVLSLNGDEWRPTATHASPLETGTKLLDGRASLEGCLGTDRLVLSGSVGEPPNSLMQVPVLVTFESEEFARLDIGDLAGLPRPEVAEPPLVFAVDRTFSDLIAHEFPHSGDQLTDTGVGPVWVLEASGWSEFPPTQVGEDWTFVVAGDSLVSFVNRRDAGAKIEVTTR